MERFRPTISTADWRRFWEEARTAIGRVLVRWTEWVVSDVPGPVGDVIAYSLAREGKRLRPALVMAVHRELGGTGDASELAAAVEVVHTYSLVHDDLPCMDDDDLRRGWPTAHRKFGVAAATEAGYRMVPLAAQILAAGAKRLGLVAGTVGQIGEELFRAAGAAGMVGGQALDLLAEGRAVSPEGLIEIHQRKTGALIRASASMGAIAAGAPAHRVEAVRSFGNAAGIAFQIVDDVLDVTSTSGELGKAAGKDAARRKASYATLVGPETARKEAQTYARAAVDHLGDGGIDSSLLEQVAHFIVHRRR